MERVTVVKTFNGNLSSRPPIFDFDVSKTRLRDRAASFSSYLRPELAPNRDRGGAEDSEISIFDAKKYFNETNEQKVLSNANNRVSPLDINLDRISEQCDLSAAGGARFSSASSADGFGRNFRSRSFRATPTASSEASWNSQTGLLANPPGAISVSLRNADHEKKKGSAARWLFGRKCPCSGKKSVQVEDKVSSETKTPKLRLSLNHTTKVVVSPNSQLPKSKSVTERQPRKSEQSPEMISISQSQNRRFSPEKHFRSERVSAPTGFTFPILDQTGPAKLDPPRDSMESLEVFRATDPRRVERDIQIFKFPTSPKTRVVLMDDDMASDASSDLFEIESFSTQTTNYPITTHPRRDSLDEAASYNARRLSGGGILYCGQEPATPSIAPTECYAPSEASIDWSVTTAEGFDRASVAAPSEFETERNNNNYNNNIGKRRGNGLLSCRCEKAVSVVGPHPQPVVKWVAAAPPVASTSSSSSSTTMVGLGLGIGASSTTKHVHVVGMGGGGGGGIGNNKPPIGRSGSGRLSLSFTT